MNQPVLAIDFGGTKIASALVSPTGDILAEAIEPTAAIVDGVARSGADILSSVTQAVHGVLSSGGVPRTGLRVGIGSAGPIELSESTVSPLNVPGWRRFPLVAGVRDYLTNTGIEVERIQLIGDGHCVALGEWWLGAARGARSAIGCITSTGVGAGIVIDGIPYQGRTGNAVHMGHNVVNALDGEPCSCGSRGCVETYASGTSMVRRAKAAGWDGEDMPGLAEAARRGEELPVRIIDEGMCALAAGLAGLATTFDVPDVVVGGGVAKAGEVIFEPLCRHFAAFARLGYISDAQILPATLPNAGLLGAAKAALLD